MSEIDDAIARVRAVADRHGLAALARAADVPYTTVQTFAKRGWTHKNLEVVRKLATGARRLSAEGGDVRHDPSSPAEDGAAVPARQLATTGELQ